MTQYIFEQHSQDNELLRLRMIEDALDSTTITILRGTGIEAGWRCLEFGAGAGSIARWMGDVVGVGGQVVAVDKNSNHLRDLSGPPYQVVTGDFLDVSLNAGFDLAHCRYVLIHNRKSQEMLEKLIALLRPGGCLCAEEPDFTSAKLLNKQGCPAQQRVNDAMCRMFEQLELDSAYGLSLPGVLAAKGLQVLRVDSRIHLHRGGDTIARMMGESTRALRDKYVATGMADAADIDKYIENTRNDQFWAVYYATVSVITRRATDRSRGDHTTNLVSRGTAG